MKFPLLTLALSFLAGGILPAQSDTLPITGQHTATAKPFRHSFSASVLHLRDVTGAGGRGSSGIEFTYLHELHPGLRLAVPARVGLAPAATDRETGNTERFVGVDLLGEYGYEVSDRINPYVIGGIGVASYDFRSASLQVPVGTGLRVRVGDAAYVFAQYAFRASLGDRAASHQGSLGVHFNLGRAKVEPKYWDADEDGINDEDDLCKDIAGPLRFKGCPDSDGDGIADPLDACPSIPGGLLDNGCPDLDGDDVGDPYDACPEVAGTPERRGCPAPDTDGDGFDDDHDACPRVQGRVGGCPDTDADGVIDSEDACPELAGTRRTDGCPDRDSDGVTDADDLCPLLPGRNQGCPDSDGDGLHDAIDECPGVSGAEADNGCPKLMVLPQSKAIAVVRPLRFAAGASELAPGSEFTLDEIRHLLARHPTHGVRITGHVDFGEEVEDRMLLSRLRAEAFAAALLEQGVDPARIAIDFVGSGQPITRSERTFQQAENRRVEFDFFVIE